MPYKEPAKRLHPLVYTLRKRRYEIGMGAAEVAERIGYELSTLQAWELGTGRPTLSSLEAWATGLGMKLELTEAK